MINQSFQYRLFFILITATLLTQCNSREVKNPLFVSLNSKKTGLEFANKLTSTKDFNLLKYMYFYNGSGVGIGDFNKDGMPDIFFASDQLQNCLYLNEGKLHFKEVTAQAGIPNDSGWSTGISVVDINNDGLLDIYVCRVGQYEVLKSKNQLLINQGVDKSGIPHFKDEAHQYGLDFSGFSTQAAFFDYDNDGDLDMFLLNHSVHENGTFRARKEFLGTAHPLSGDRIFRNDGQKFTDVTLATGINTSAIGYGLGICIADINLDGYPDIYIGNDFHENDYLYINQKNGTFREEGVDELMHTSQFTMGVDVADVDNDGYPEIISMDMLPSDPYILKRSLGEDEYDIFNLKIGYGYSYQYTRNNLQYNRKNGHFSETGLYSGVASTDWSWSALWMDFDNDGKKDLFISNGIPKRMNDIDYIDYISNDVVQAKIKSNNMEESDLALIEKFPEIKLPNRFLHNDGNLKFGDIGDSVKDAPRTFSNGAAYADFDNDGDLDIVVNNIADPALIYENKADQHGIRPALALTLTGPNENIDAIGSKVLIYSGKSIRSYEKYPVRGFMSSMNGPMLIGTDNASIDSIIVIWPDRKYERIDYKNSEHKKIVRYRPGLAEFDFSRFSKVKRYESNSVQDITDKVGLNYLHQENQFQEFNRETLIPHLVSTEGPALAVGDLNGDGLEDVFAGAARNHKPAVFFQQKNGKFAKVDQPSLDIDSIYEDVDAIITDVNGDGNKDLVVASGGNEFFGADDHRLPRVYLNDGHGQLTRCPDAFSNIFMTASSIAANDINKDGFNDLFIGGRVVPWEYGDIPRSYLMLNDGTGKFRDVTKEIAPELQFPGMVTGAQWFDIDKDGDLDLLLSLEWGVPTVFINNNGRFTKRELCQLKGWWNFLLPCDVDNDGDIDLIAGNLGQNSRLKASASQPVKLYHADFDGNGKREQVLTYYVEGKEIPFANKSELEKQMPVMRKRFRHASEFAEATLTDLFGDAKLEGAQRLTANYFSNCVLLNDGHLNFKAVDFPWQAQLTSFKTAVQIDANNDNLPDLLLMGNFYGNNIEMGRYDADYGTVLLNKGRGEFKAEGINDLQIKGEVRHIKAISIAKKGALIIARNNDSLKVITNFNGKRDN